MTRFADPGPESDPDRIERTCFGSLNPNSKSLTFKKKSIFTKLQSKFIISNLTTFSIRQTNMWIKISIKIKKMKKNTPVL